MVLPSVAAPDNVDVPVTANVLPRVAAPVNVDVPVTANAVNVPTVVIVGCDAVWILPVKLPSMFATNVPTLLIDKIPVALLVADVAPILNLFVLSFQPINARLEPPRSIKIPASFVGVVVPLDNMIMLSLTSRFAVFIVVVVPFTVRSPVTTKFWPMFAFPAIPTPPATTNAPVDVVVDAVVADSVVIPDTANVLESAA